MQAVKKSGEKKQGHAIISRDVKSYSNEPFFAKKTAEAKETISKVGLPASKMKLATQIK